VSIPLHENPPDTDESTNGQVPPEDEPSDWTVITGAADYTTLIRPKNTAISRKYRDDTYSILKSLAIGAINVGDMADAATIFHYGPSFGIAVGQLAQADERARKPIDWLTTPSNPYVLLLMSAIPMISQLARNHEKALQEIPRQIKMGRRQRKAMKATKTAQPPRFTMRILGREIPIRFNTPKLGGMLRVFRTESHDPTDLVNHVFSDTDLLKALESQGLIIIRKSPDGM
jgi:hypothetical protein